MMIVENLESITKNKLGKEYNFTMKRQRLKTYWPIFF